MTRYPPPVLYYHTVAPRRFDSWVLSELTLEIRYFEDQLAYLTDRGFRTILLDEWLRYRQRNERASGKEICITFDDGYLDNWVYVLPLMKKYGMCFTLFVSPECIDSRDVVRPTLEDVWGRACRESDLESMGYLSWREVELMHESGYVDIQSHTMSHTKYVASTRLDAFYYGGKRGLYPLWNRFPERKPTYAFDPDFEALLQWGTPLFEEQSSVIARKHTINPDFEQEVLSLARSRDLRHESQRPPFEIAARRIYQSYLNSGRLLESVESAEEHEARLHYEVVDSKRILESRLGKPVEFLCWPHGDNTLEAHQLALTSGYKATTSGKMTGETGRPDRIPRIGADWRRALWLNRRKMHYKIASNLRKQPYYSIWLLNEYKNELLGRR